MDAPLEHMIKTLPLVKKKIQKYCKDHAKSWPKEGTFQEYIVEHALTYIRSKYQKKKRKKREAILSLWWVFCDMKINVKLTEPKEAAKQVQEKPIEKALEKPSSYGLCFILPAAGYQGPVRVEQEEERTDVKGAEGTPGSRSNSSSGRPGTEEKRQGNT
ncbi:hypothetical protein NDU88_003069 [Pleurodeles waltl]|uniref:Uncharacterized protein n=1 Tax=Pleurodeles waltl TaxID=8319 RepID=A0AAV7W131_PLEWA|nr:hypothetical protein NDU88_003069 [Pleurodeles waltl]